MFLFFLFFFFFLEKKVRGKFDLKENGAGDDGRWFLEVAEAEAVAVDGGFWRWKARRRTEWIHLFQPTHRNPPSVLRRNFPLPSPSTKTIPKECFSSASSPFVWVSDPPLYREIFAEA